jgi:hypothetical protein
MASVDDDHDVFKAVVYDRCWAPLANQLHALQGNDRSRATSSTYHGIQTASRRHAAWNERRRSHGPPSQNFCSVGVPPKGHTDITRGTLQALRLVKARGFYQTSIPHGFHSIPLGRNVHSWPFSCPLIPASLAGPVRLLRVPFHVHLMSASSMCGPALLPHHHDRRALQLQITQITLSDP